MNSLKAVSTVVSMVVLVGCGAPKAEISSADAPIPWEQFRDQAYRDEDGAFVMNGDELVEDERAMRELYLRYVEGFSDVQKLESSLVVNRVDGRDDKWAKTKAANLTYCVSASSFGNRYDDVVKALREASAAWEAAAQVKFVYQSASDASCSKSTSSVVFNVRLVKSGQYLARAFFPSTARSRRELLIDLSAFNNIFPYTLTGILRHELGHALGFRHEHTRPEAGVCYEDKKWRALTPYDSESVMHYPHCHGSNRRDLVLTQRDYAGAAALYPR